MKEGWQRLWLRDAEKAYSNLFWSGQIHSANHIKYMFIEEMKARKRKYMLLPPSEKTVKFLRNIKDLAYGIV